MTTTEDLTTAPAPACSGLPVNSCVPLYGGGNPPDLYEDTGGGVWLKTGVIESDASKYPDAHLIGHTPTGRVIDSIWRLLSGAFDGSHIWLLGRSSSRMFLLKYTVDRTLLLSVEITDEPNILDTTALTFDGEHLVTSYLGGIKKWNKDTGAAVSDSVYNVGNINGIDLCWDGNFYRELGPDGRVQTYSATGQRLGLYTPRLPFNNGGVVRATSLAWDGRHFWAGAGNVLVGGGVTGPGYVFNCIYQLDAEFEFTGYLFYVRGYISNLKTLLWVDGKLWAGDAFGGKLHQLQEGGVGEPLALFNNKTGYPYYVKVK